MVGKVAELKNALQPDSMAGAITSLYTDWKRQRDPWEAEQIEKRNFLFATDTSKTSNATLPWKNKTTLPKLTQIRDNLHANYREALFPNDQWLRWTASDEASISKRRAIEAYMNTKLKQQRFETTVSLMLLDYIDAGNVFGDVIYVNEFKIDDETGERIQGYVGPKAVRISPYDIVFNPIASSFKETPKIIRSLHNIGELLAAITDSPDNSWIRENLETLLKYRKSLGTYSTEDFRKAQAYSIDGFGDLKSYYQSSYVELLEFYGDYFDPEEQVLHKNKIITVMDRCKVVRIQTNPSWLSHSTQEHVGWRLRPDNLYAMGPLDNLVGMQYRIDHLENAKADAVDLNILPPLKIIGEVKDFNWGPNEEIHIDESGDVVPISPDLSALNIDNEIVFLTNMMEELAGAPKQAMGIRTPGEKTAFEVQSLQTAAGRIFQEKVRNFEINFLEPLLNNMLEVARRNLDGSDLVRSVDDDFGVEEFLKITKEDITANGKLLPVGSRHFANTAQLIQNLTALSNSNIMKMVSPHISRKRLATLVEDTLGLEKYKLFGTNLGTLEDIELQQLQIEGAQLIESQLNAGQTEPQPTEDM